jgi:hypothetical protein
MELSLCKIQMDIDRCLQGIRTTLRRINSCLNIPTVPIKLLYMFDVRLQLEIRERASLPERKQSKDLLR